MKHNELKNDASIFDSNVRAEDGLRRTDQKRSAYQEILFLLGVMAAIFLGCLVVALIRC
jgi:hypothetical protein